MPEVSYLWQKKTFDTLGGYKDFRCAGDTDFLERSKRFGYNITEPVGSAYFKRRVHDNSLTLNKETSLSSSNLRKQYHKQIEEDLKNGIITITPVTASYTEIIF